MYRLSIDVAVLSPTWSISTLYSLAKFTDHHYLSPRLKGGLLRPNVGQILCPVLLRFCTDRPCDALRCLRPDGLPRPCTSYVRFRSTENIDNHISTFNPLETALMIQGVRRNLAGKAVLTLFSRRTRVLLIMENLQKDGHCEVEVNCELWEMQGRRRYETSKRTKLCKLNSVWVHTSACLQLLAPIGANRFLLGSLRNVVVTRHQVRSVTLGDVMLNEAKTNSVMMTWPRRRPE
jgi:hypothetical protein